MLQYDAAEDQSQFSSVVEQPHAQSPGASEFSLLQLIAAQAELLVPEIRAWGMQQYEKHGGDFDAMMRDARSFSTEPAEVDGESDAP